MDTPEKLEGRMLARLGDVLYWAASIASALILAFMFWAMSEAASWKDYLLHPDRLIVVGCAVLIWLFGRACRYVLSGR
jgi:hypothetical protein